MTRKNFKQFRFLDWEVYQDAKMVYKEIRKIVMGIPKERRFEIGAQVSRSGLSVLLNIAEGSGKASKKELLRFLDIALGSLYETRAALDVLWDETDLVSREKNNEVITKIESIANQLGGFIKSIR